jgi:hypothetical protein
MKTIMIAAALALVAVPAAAAPQKARSSQAPQSAFGAVTPFGSPVQAANPKAREAAIRECSAAAAKTYAVRDSNWSISYYRMCMAEHGQME